MLDNSTSNPHPPGRCGAGTACPAHGPDGGYPAAGHGPFAMGLDIGSTTVKVVLMDGATVVHQEYRRHHADVRGGLVSLLDELATAYPYALVRPGVTGSGGLGVAGLLGVPFIQEVIAETQTVRRFHPEADVIIELGGEDAKITYLKPVPEQRMNGTCAGGTGAFIDQMAALLHTDAAGLNDLAADHTHIYPIASRCGVFAKSDLQPLINEGAAKTDLAASIFQSVATQTIAGLACGRPVRGNVLLLGGPLHFLPELGLAYQRVLAGSGCAFTTPAHAQLYVAMGAALLADGDVLELPELVARLRGESRWAPPSGRMRPLFADPGERAEFTARHARAAVQRLDTELASGPCYLGIDAGSTTIKAVVIDDRARIVFSHYASNAGDPVAGAVRIVRRVHRELPAGATIARSCVTGYGEALIKAALKIDEGEIETVAHHRAAEHVCPGVTAVVDIGGQDMKYLRVRGGAIDSIAVNEACSSGCGSFLQTFAETMGTDLRAFSRAALESDSPVDLGSRCTVFMNSSVKQAQKDGASVGDISAGLSYSVVRNALYKVIKLRDPAQLGSRVVVQGGTFLNDAVLRAFELLTGVQVIRPDVAGLMGAYGAALIARERHTPGGPPGRLLGRADLAQLTVDTALSACKLCQNHCQRTISTFNSGERHISGNRCDRGAGGPDTAASTLPNLFDYKYRRLFGYRRRTAADAPRGDIGIPRALNMYENYPFWFTVLSNLGFRVIISGRSSHRLFESGMDGIPSENVCYPAKLAHGHVINLVDRGVKTIFYPCVTHEADRMPGADDHYNCPVVASYPEVIRVNVDQLGARDVRLISPFVNLGDPSRVADRLVEAFAGFGVTREEARAALAAGYAEDAAVRADIRAEGLRALRFMAETGTRGVVLAGRPYHVDPEVHHGIPELVNGLGMAVLTEDAVVSPGLLERPLRVRDQWAYHSRLYEAAAFAATRDDLELVQLTSFGCGLDAITGDQVQEILEAKRNVYTVLKIDEVSNLGAARIRLRSLAAATREREQARQREQAREREQSADREQAREREQAGEGEPAGVREEVRDGERARDGGPAGVREEVRERAAAVRSPGTHVGRRPVFTREKRERHTLVAPQLSPIHFRLLESAFRRSGYRVEVLERVCPEDVEIGLKYVNNDACYPAILVVGQLVNAFLTGRYDPERTSVIITQTGGMCRATNYAGLLRKGLREAGFEDVAVVAISVDGLEDNPGFSLTPALVHRAMQAIVLGDVLQAALLRVRPYEAQPGLAHARYQHWDRVAREYLADRGRSATLGRRVRYGGLIRLIVADFDALPLRDTPRRPRVGIVGEILVKFHPDANNHAVRVVESAGCEAVLPGLSEFVLQSVYTLDWNYRNLGTDRKARRTKKALGRVLEWYRRPLRRAFARTGGKFAVPDRIEELAGRASTVLSLGNQAGEGWLLTAEMLELIENGVPNIICVQPFACLPNHVVGKGMFRELRRRYPQANIAAIDYDPGASEVNQLNRIKLMISTAHMQHGEGIRQEKDPLPQKASPLEQTICHS